VTSDGGGPAPSRPTVAAFDFDGTLTNGGSVVPFLVWLRGLRTVLVAIVRCAPWLLRGALASGSAADDAKEMLFGRLLTGLPADRVDAAGEKFAAHHLRRRLRPEVKARLDWHRKQGHYVVIVSASLENYVLPAGELLGADGVLATRLGVGGGGLLTGRYEGKNCRGAEKYNRLVGWLRANGLSGNGATQPIIWAYGNSRGDLRLLRAADRGINAGQLGRFGRLRHFEPLATLGSDAP
jgi:phosphatidylglycerophosphatase C